MLNLWLVLLLGFAGCAVGEQASISTKLIEQKITETCRKQPSAFINTVTGLTGMKLGNASVDSVHLNPKTSDLSLNLAMDMSSKEVDLLRINVAVSVKLMFVMSGRNPVIKITGDTSLNININMRSTPLTQSMHSALTTTLNHCLKTPVTAGIQSVLNSVNDQCAAVASATEGLTTLVTRVTSMNIKDGAVNMEYNIVNSAGQTVSSSGGGSAPPALKPGEMFQMSISEETLSNAMSAMTQPYKTQIPSTSFQPHFKSGLPLGQQLNFNIQTRTPVSGKINQRGIISIVRVTIRVSSSVGTTLLEVEVRACHLVQLSGGRNSFPDLALSSPHWPSAVKYKPPRCLKDVTVNLNLSVTDAAISMNVANMSLKNSAKLTFTHKDYTSKNMTQTLDLHLVGAIQNMAAQQSCNGKNLLHVPFVNCFQTQPPLTGTVHYAAGQVIVIYKKSSPTPPGCPTCPA